MIHKIRRRNGFAQIANPALRDTRLSYCARGILAMVMSHSESWKTTTTWIRSQTPAEGQVAVANAIKQLQQFGYLLIQRDKGGDGKMRGCVWTWTDEPELLQADSPHVGIPDDGCPVDDDPSASEYVSQQEQNTGEDFSDDYASEPDPEDLLPKEQQLPIEAIPPSPTPNSARPPSAPLAKPTPKPRPKNVLLETMLELTGVDPSKATDEQFSFANKFLSQIKKVDPGVTPVDLRLFAAQKRQEWDGLPFTPRAFAKHWQPISGSGHSLSSGRSVEQIENEIRACRGWPQHMEHDKATDEEKAQYASLKAKRKELIQ